MLTKKLAKEHIQKLQGLEAAGLAQLQVLKQVLRLAVWQEVLLCREPEL